MKEFLVYNVLRLALLASSFVIVVGVWALVSDQVPLLGALIVSLLLSGISSWFLLARQREALAVVLEERSRRASQKFEEFKARDDED